MQQETKEFVWNARLSNDEKIVKWRGREDGALEQIVLKLAVLGSGAKEGERNLVEVTSFNSEQEKVKACICALTGGKIESQQLADLSLFPPVNLALCEGSGPVEIVGNHIVLDEDFSDDDDEDDDDEEDLSDTEMISDLRQKLMKKNAAKGDAPLKQRSKKEAQEEDFEEIDDDDEDMDDDDDDEDEEQEEKKELPGKKRAKSAAKKQDDDKEEDDEQGEEEAPSKKRKITNGKSEKKPSLTSPERTTKSKPELKTPKSQKNGDASKTPKSEKKTPAKVQYKSLEEIKAVIQKYPGGKPRKEDKFCNWVRNNYKVENQSWVEQLWKWHQKEMGM